jgi:hypothetical protein
VNRETFIEKLTDVRQTVERLLAQLEASEHDKFAAHLYRSRREYRSACERAGKSGKQIERLGRELEVSLATPECITDEFQCRCLHALPEVRNAPQCNVIYRTAH